MLIPNNITVAINQKTIRVKVNTNTYKKLLKEQPKSPICFELVVLLF